MVFPKKWLENHPKFLSYFLIHIDALMLCRMNLTRNFGVMTIFFKNSKFLKKAWSKKWLKNHPKFLSYFLIHNDALMLCRKF